MSKQAMANYARNAVQAADDLNDRRGNSLGAAAKGWAPVFAGSAAAIAHAICELADAITARKDGGA